MAEKYIGCLVSIMSDGKIHEGVIRSLCMMTQQICLSDRNDADDVQYFYVNQIQNLKILKTVDELSAQISTKASMTPSPAPGTYAEIRQPPKQAAIFSGFLRSSSENGSRQPSTPRQTGSNSKPLPKPQTNNAIQPGIFLPSQSSAFHSTSNGKTPSKKDNFSLPSAFNIDTRKLDDDFDFDKANSCFDKKASQLETLGTSSVAFLGPEHEKVYGISLPSRDDLFARAEKNNPLFLDCMIDTFGAHASQLLMTLLSPRLEDSEPGRVVVTVCPGKPAALYALSAARHLACGSNVSIIIFVPPKSLWVKEEKRFSKLFDAISQLDVPIIRDPKQLPRGEDKPHIVLNGLSGVTDIYQWSNGLKDWLLGQGVPSLLLDPKPSSSWTARWALLPGPHPIVLQNCFQASKLFLSFVPISPNIIADSNLPPVHPTLFFPNHTVKIFPISDST